jgi:isoleucyl-tRNA synthetase
LIVPERPNFPEEEEKVLKYWQEIDAFKKQLELTKGKPLYTFYDGPPFATGLPHYGHIAAGTIKVSFAEKSVWLPIIVSCSSATDLWL